MKSLLLGVCHFKLLLAIHSYSAFPPFQYNYGSDEAEQIPGSIDEQRVVDHPGIAFGSEERGFRG
jgi:hypothetical protein